jgi:hypothetical protein
MTEELINIIRTYIEDPTAPYTVSDIVIERFLNKGRKYLEDLQLFAEDYYGDNVSTVYPIGYPYLTNVSLKDGEGNTISTDDYTVDVFNGIITFDASPVVIPDAVYATFNYFNFFATVADIWLYRAALATTMGNTQLGDEILPKGKNSVEYCSQKYWTYRQSISRQMER